MSLGSINFLSTPHNRHLQEDIDEQGWDEISHSPDGKAGDEDSLSKFEEVDTVPDEDLGRGRTHHLNVKK